MAKFNGSEGAPIERGQAAEWTANYRKKLTEDGKDKGIKAHFFGREILDKILSQEGCMGIRMYYALDEEGQQQLVLVGADADGNDQEDGTIADNSKICPPDCSSDGDLNG